MTHSCTRRPITDQWITKQTPSKPLYENLALWNRTDGEGIKVNCICELVLDTALTLTHTIFYGNNWQGVYIAQIPLGSSRHVSTRLDTLERVETSVSSRAVRQARSIQTKYMRSPCRDVTWRAKLNLGLYVRILSKNECEMRQKQNQLPDTSPESSQLTKSIDDNSSSDRNDDIRKQNNAQNVNETRTFAMEHSDVIIASVGARF